MRSEPRSRTILVGVGTVMLFLAAFLSYQIDVTAVSKGGMVTTAGYLRANSPSLLFSSVTVE